MGSIRRIKNKSGVVWRAEIFVSGSRESKRFPTKPEASDWIQAREAELERRSGIDSGRTLAHALLRYADEESPKKKGRRWEVVRIHKFLRDPIANVPILDLRLEDAETFRDSRLEQVQAGSVIRELNLLKSVVRRSVKWKWIPSYPWDGFELPPRPRPRDRLITDDEIQAFMAASGVSGSEPVTLKIQEVGILFRLGTCTGMRLGEMCSLEWRHVNLNLRVAHLPDTKNGDPRNVSLSSLAVSLLERMPRIAESVFSVKSDNASALAIKIRRKAGLSGFTMHDTRHKAITDLAEKLEPYELARMCGFRNLNQVMTYYNKSAAEIAKKLD